MSSTRTAVVKRALGEFVVIVVGVLVALQFEDLRDQREIRQQELAALEAVDRDLAETLSRLERDILWQTQSIGAQQVLLNIADGLVSMPPPDSMARLVSQSFIFQRLEPVTGAYDALVNAGDLRLVSNDTLRAGLAALFGSIGDGYEDEDLSTLFRNEYLMAISNTSTLRSATGDVFTERMGLAGSPPGADYDALIRDRRLVTALASMAMAEGNQLTYFERLRVDLGRTRAMLARELASS